MRRSELYDYWLIKHLTTDDDAVVVRDNSDSGRIPNFTHKEELIFTLFQRTIAKRYPVTVVLSSSGPHGHIYSFDVHKLVMPYVMPYENSGGHV